MKARRGEGKEGLGVRDSGPGSDKSTGAVGSAGGEGAQDVTAPGLANG